MIGRLVVLAFVLVGAVASTVAIAAVPVPQDFAYGQPIVVPEPATGYRIALPINVYRLAVHADLGDLRVFNAAGEIVPYALRRPRLETLQRLPARALPLFPLTSEANSSLDAIRVTVESGHGAVNVETRAAAQGKQAIVSYILDARSVDRPLAALSLEWPLDAAEFAGRLRVEATDDLSAWRLILPGAAVANLGTQADRLIERRIEFSPRQAKYWRLTWLDGQAPFVLTGAQGEPTDDRVELVRETLMLTAQTDEKHPGEFSFDTNARLPVDRAGLELPETNSIVHAEILSRPTSTAAWHALTRHGFYRLTGPNGEITSDWVPLSYNTDRFWLVRIDRAASGLGARAPKLALGWVPHELVFIARGAGPFQLAYGSVTAQPDEVPVESILPEIATADTLQNRVKIAAAKLGPQVMLGGEARRVPPPPPFPWKSLYLWGALALGVVVLAFMAMRLSRETRSSGSSGPSVS